VITEIKNIRIQKEIYIFVHFSSERACVLHYVNKNNIKLTSLSSVVPTRLKVFHLVNTFPVPCELQTFFRRVQNSAAGHCLERQKCRPHRHVIFATYFNVILHLHLRCIAILFPTVFFDWNVCITRVFHACHIPSLPHAPWPDSRSNVRRIVQTPHIQLSNLTLFSLKIMMIIPQSHEKPTWMTRTFLLSYR
jgi:hypothetical protein